MDLQKFSYLVKKYKKGECSPQEKEMLESYLESFQSNNEWIEDEMGDKEITERKIYSAIIRNIKKERKNYLNKTFSSPALLKRAAIIIFSLILVSGILYESGIFEQKADSIVWNEKVTLPGEKSQITLPDGSKVTLNADSKLRYPNQFDDKSRKVYLEGEGYFVVRHNINLPFIVCTGNLTTTVLGTKFNVSAYPEKKTIAVSLLEGKVKVSRDEKGKVSEIVVLKPKEQILYNKEKNVSLFKTFDSLETIGWKDNIYKFENEPLGEVLSHLERALGVKFKLDKQSVLAQKITVKFEKNSLRTVVEVIKSLTGLNYKIVKGNNDKKEVLFF